MRFLRTPIVFGGLSLFLISQTGCIAVAAAAGAGAGVAYVRGASVITVEGSPPEVATAAEQAFSQLGIAVVSSTSSAAHAEVIARTPRDEKVSVTVEAQSCNLSRLSVRVGVFGDRCFQNRVLSQISANLTTPAAPLPAAETRSEND